MTSEPPIRAITGSESFTQEASWCRPCDRVKTFHPRRPTPPASELSRCQSLLVSGHSGVCGTSVRDSSGSYGRVARGWRRVLGSGSVSNPPTPRTRRCLSTALVERAGTSCPGCWCRDRVRSYPSDLTDAEWEVLRPRAVEVMAELKRATGRPMAHDLRAMVEAIAYVVRNGIEWRALPVDFPPHTAVYAFFQRWAAKGLPARLTGRLRP
ncbi:MAG TPA: transposase [Kineosporiaceae bacterium]